MSFFPMKSTHSWRIFFSRDCAGRFCLDLTKPGGQISTTTDRQLPRGWTHPSWEGAWRRKPQSSGEGLEDAAKLLLLQVLPARGSEVVMGAVLWVVVLGDAQRGWTGLKG